MTARGHQELLNFRKVPEVVVGPRVRAVVALTSKCVGEIPGRHRRVLLLDLVVSRKQLWDDGLHHSDLPGRLCLVDGRRNASSVHQRIHQELNCSLVCKPDQNGTCQAERDSDDWPSSCIGGGAEQPVIGKPETPAAPRIKYQQAPTAPRTTFPVPSASRPATTRVYANAGRPGTIRTAGPTAAPIGISDRQSDAQRARSRHRSYRVGAPRG
jgi:hypothetical protein